LPAVISTEALRYRSTERVMIGVTDWRVIGDHASLLT
jgi:hypothetical protein